MSLKVKYIDVPEGAQEAVQAEGQGQPFSNPASVAIGSGDTAYATLEPEGWPLDGGRDILPDEPADFWWSAAASNAQGVFEDPPVITFKLPAAYTATGISFTFSPAAEEWCSEIRVTWYNAGTVLHQATTQPDSPRWTLQKTVEGFDQIRVELLKTNLPGHFAKLQRIEIGQTYWFDQTEITDVRVLNEIDPTLSELTVDTMQVKIYDRQSRALAPQKNQRMELYRDGELYAVQYIAESVRESKQFYSFSCQSAIGLLEDEYLGGIYADVPIETVLEDILDGLSFELDKSFTAVKVTGYLPICTRREALQQLLLAVGAIASTQHSDVICIYPVPSGVSTPFTKGDVFEGAKIETSPQIAKVEVIAHRYAEMSEEEQLLDAEKISGENVLITFEEPHHSYSISGGKITGNGANWVTVTANGEVTLSGKKYLHSTSRHTKRNPEATAAERNNVYTVEEATLIHKGNVDGVLKRLYAIAQLRQTLTQEVVVSDQRAGQIVVSAGAWENQIKGYIRSMESTLTQTGHTASVTILGTEIVFDGFRYAGELYAGDVGVLT